MPLFIDHQGCDDCCPPPPVGNGGSIMLEACSSERNYDFGVEDNYYCCPSTVDAPSNNSEWQIANRLAWYCQDNNYNYDYFCDNYSINSGMGGDWTKSIEDYCSYVTYDDRGELNYCHHDNPVLGVRPTTQAWIVYPGSGRLNPPDPPTNGIVVSADVLKLAWGTQRKSHQGTGVGVFTNAGDLQTKAMLYQRYFRFRWPVDPGDTLQTPHGFHKVKITYKHLAILALRGTTLAPQGKLATYITSAALENQNCGQAENRTCSTTPWPTPSAMQLYYGAWDIIANEDQKELLTGGLTKGEMLTPTLNNEEIVLEHTSVTSVSPTGSENGVGIIIAPDPVCFASNPFGAGPAPGKTWFDSVKFYSPYQALKVKKIEVLDASDVVQQTYNFDFLGFPS